MSAPVADFDFTFPYTSIEHPSPPLDFCLEPSLLEFGDYHYTTPIQQGKPRHTQPKQTSHTRSSSRSSVYSAASSLDSTSTRFTTPPRGSPVRHHGPILLPKIRPQDQEIDALACTPPPAAPKANRFTHSRSYTNPETLNNMAFAHMAFSPMPQPEDGLSSSLLCSPADFVQNASSSVRRSSSVDAYNAYNQMPQPNFQNFSFSSSYTPRAPSPLSITHSPLGSTMDSMTPEPVSSTTLMAFLTSPNPAASLVRTLTHPHRDPHLKHFWWDVRSIRSWSGFNVASVMALPGAALLKTPVPAPVLQVPSMSARHPETEAALHNTYALYYLPKLNSALALSSNRPLKLSVPPIVKGCNDLLFTANLAGDRASANAMFGGKPTARVVGLVRSFDRFNTGMRCEGNIKRVEYLRGLSAVHYAMREHGTRYGFILTEIELVIVRNGTETTPNFGDLEITSIPLTTSSEDKLTACLALWGLCQIASDNAPPGHVHWKSEIGAPAEGTRRKAKARDSWMPSPQLAEKREAKRGRGWVMPEDAVGRKEMGKRGVRYGGV